jgi:hypothetical protein
MDAPAAPREVPLELDELGGGSGAVDALEHEENRRDGF